MPAPAAAEPAAASTPRSGLSVTDLRRLWPEVLEEVKGKRRFTWILLSQNAQIVDVREGILVLALANVGARDSFAKGGNEEVVREALISVIGHELRIETLVDPGTPVRSGPPARSEPATRSEPVPQRQPNRQDLPSRPDPIQEPPPDDPDAVADRNDSDLDEAEESHTELLARHLGAEVIAEEEHGA